MESEGAGRALASFTPAEEEKFLTLSRSPDIYEKMASSISPSISGDYTVDIKRALACLLFGGSRKVCLEGGSTGEACSRVGVSGICIFSCRSWRLCAGNILARVP